MKPVVVVGAGLSGVACAREVAAAGLSVRLVDRGRRIGGRMASKRWGERQVDLGASYFTVSDDAFAAVVDDWQARGLATPWTDTFVALAPGVPPEAKSGPLRWSAPGALRSLVEDLTEGLPLEQAAVARVGLDADGEPVVDGVPAAAVVLAMPDAQAARLLDPDLASRIALEERVYDPVIALVARWPERTWDRIDPGGRFDGAFVNGDDTVAWIADDGRRRGDDAPVLVVHSTTTFAAAHLVEPDEAREPMVSAVCRLLDLPAPASTHVHRWSLARPAGERRDRFLLTDDRVGFCGDGWGSDPKVETAWLSGRALGRAVVEQVGSHPNGR